VKQEEMKRGIKMIEKYLDQCIGKEISIDFSYGDSCLLGSIKSFVCDSWKELSEDSIVYLVEINENIRLCFDNLKIDDEADNILILSRGKDTVIEIMLDEDEAFFEDEKEEEFDDIFKKNVISYLINHECENCPLKPISKLENCKYAFRCPIDITADILMEQK
jgi:hypothetical protein